MRLAIWLASAVFVALTVAGAETASAQISGEFAYALTTNCISIVPPATFNSSFQPTAGPISHEANNIVGTITFNSNGTGTVVGDLALTAETPVLPGSFMPPNSAANSATLSFNFTYTIAPSGILTLTMVSGSFLQNVLTGPNAGQTGTLDVLTYAGYQSADGNHFLATQDGTYVQTLTFSNGDVSPQVCTGTLEGFKFP